MTDLRETLMKIRYDCTAIQSKLTDAFQQLDALNLPSRPDPGPVCDECFCGNGIHTLDCSHATIQRCEANLDGHRCTQSAGHFGLHSTSEVGEARWRWWRDKELEIDRDSVGWPSRVGP